MKLIPLFTVSLRQTETVLVGPLAGGDSLAWGIGEGTVSGRIRGTVKGMNAPRLRADGVNEPNVTGVIRSDDGQNVLYEMRGRAQPPAVANGPRQIFASMIFRTAAADYEWLNAVCAFVEAELASGQIEYRVFEPQRE